MTSPVLFFFGFSALLFFYEVNVRRNISLYRVLKLFFLGGIISLILSLVLYVAISREEDIKL